MAGFATCVVHVETIRFIENAIVRYTVNRFCKFCHLLCVFFKRLEQCISWLLLLFNIYVCDEIPESTIDYKAEIIDTRTHMNICLS